MFVEYDRYTGLTVGPTPIAQFPAPGELRARYEQKVGFSLDDPAARPLLVRYTGGEATRRYYQDAAIRAVLEKIARCEKKGEPRRALLSLATGSGKTFIAVNLLKRIADAAQLRRALFICDRDELRNQGLVAFQNLFGADAAAVSAGNPQKNARILIGTYQTLNVDSDEAEANFLTTNYPENYFSHIVIDECHRSAWGKWSQVLKRNPNAVQVGLTATPRRLEITESTPDTQADAKLNADNLEYFGEPVYEYDIGQGIEDGYLAACEIQKSRVNLDDTGITIDQILARNPTNALTGLPDHPRTAQGPLREDRATRTAFCSPTACSPCVRTCFKYLVESGGPEQKTIIFCARDRHADDVAAEYEQPLRPMVREERQAARVEPYAFKCTASVGGSEYLADLRGASRSHFIATTVDLLYHRRGCTRGAEHSVLQVRQLAHRLLPDGRPGNSPATRRSNKLMFRVYDYTNATRLFGKQFVVRRRGRGQEVGARAAGTSASADPRRRL